MFDSKPVLVTTSDLENLVEILSDERAYAIVVGKFWRFEAATEYYEGLIATKPPMRVTLRRFAHLYGNYIPARLHNSYDRAVEYPM